MKDNTSDIEQVLQDITFDDAIDCTHKDLLEQKLLLNFNAAQARHANKWRFVMSSKVTRIAAVAAILIAVVVGLQFLDGTSSTIWAQVRDQVAAAKAVIYKAKIVTTENGQPVQLLIEATLSSWRSTSTRVCPRSRSTDRSSSWRDAEMTVRSPRPLDW